MLNTEDGQKMMVELCKLKKKAGKTREKNDQKLYEQQLSYCMVQFDYLVKMHTGKYKKFSNYQDLMQEGRVSLLSAMNTFDPRKGSFFSWAHHYITTRISRSANLHSTIRYPLKIAAEIPPHKETFMPTQIEEHFCPDKELESMQSVEQVHAAFACLNKEQKDVLSLAFGIGTANPISANQACKKLNMTKIDFNNVLELALSKMKEIIKT